MRMLYLFLFCHRYLRYLVPNHQSCSVAAKNEPATTLQVIFSTAPVHTCWATLIVARTCLLSVALCSRNAFNHWFLVKKNCRLLFPYAPSLRMCARPPIFVSLSLFPSVCLSVCLLFSITLSLSLYLSLSRGFFTDYGVDGTRCAFRIYLSYVESWCPEMEGLVMDPIETSAGRLSHVVYPIPTL